MTDKPEKMRSKDGFVPDDGEIAPAIPEGSTHVGSLVIDVYSLPQQPDETEPSWDCAFRVNGEVTFEQLMVSLLGVFGHVAVDAMEAQINEVPAEQFSEEVRQYTLNGFGQSLGQSTAHIYGHVQQQLSTASTGLVLTEQMLEHMARESATNEKEGAGDDRTD